MFVAKFSQVNSDKFSTDKNGESPFIGEVLAGRAKGTLINGTVFKRTNLRENTLYACDNVEDVYEGKKQIRVQILAEVSALDYPQYRTKLGVGLVDIESNADATPVANEA